MKKLIFVFLFFCHNLLAQSAIEWCGSTYRKPVPTRIYSDGPKYYDRFGNEYVEEEVADVQEFVVFECESGYFRLFFDKEFSDKEKTVFCKVFKDLSELITSKYPTNSKIDIRIVQEYFNPTIALLGSPMWSKKCGIQSPLISLMITNGNPFYDKPFPVGTIIVNSSFRDNDAFYLDELDKDVIDPLKASGKIDLYTGATHEAMHILGILSLIGSDLKPAYLGEGYSAWDKLLFSSKLNKNVLEATLPDKDELFCSKYKITSGIGINDLNDCSDQIFIQTNNYKTFIAKTDNPNAAYDINSLSHILNNCVTNSDLHVMHPNGDDYYGKRVLLSKAEKELLCTLGYSINNVGKCSSQCLVNAIDDYIPTIYKAKDEFKITFKDILSNDINYDPISIPEIDYSSLSGAVIITDNNISGGFFKLKIDNPGTYKINYKIVGCGNQCDYGTIYVTIVNFGIECSPVNDCELLCYGDFEGFGVGINNYFTQLQFPTKPVIKYTITDLDNSPDIVKNTKANNQFLQMHKQNNYESVYLQLRKDGILPNCESFISFDGVSDKANSKVKIYGFSDAMCGKINEPTMGCQSTAVQFCATKSNDFYCIGELDLEQQKYDYVSYGTNTNPPTQATTALFPNSSHRILKWKNTTGISIDKILIYVYNEKEDELKYAFDNFSVISTCGDQNIFAISSEIIQPFVPGQTTKIKYTIQATSLNSTIVSDVSFQALVQPTNFAISILGNSDFNSKGIASLKIKSGETKVIYLDISVSNSISIPYSGNVFLSIEKATNSCYLDGNYIVNKTPIQIEPDFTYKIIDFCSNAIKFIPNNTTNTHIWNFGDATPDLTEVSPVHIYAKQGTYLVTHTIKNGSTIVSQSIGYVTTQILLKQNISSMLLQKVLTNNTVTTGQQFSINGTFTIDKNYDFINCDFVMGNGAKIEINEGIVAKFSSCKFFSCNQMWQGIEVLSSTKGLVGGEIIMTNCLRVEDAHNAIRLYDKSKATITNNNFQNNYISIFSENCNLEAFSVYDNKHNGGKLKDLYKGQIIIPNQKNTYAAYWLDNVKQGISALNIGNTTPSKIGATENMQNMTNGILSHNTSISVQNFSISNMISVNNTEGYGIFCDSDNPQGHLLIVNGFNNDKTLYTFNNCRVAIYNLNVRSTISNNRIKDVQIGILNDFSIGGTVKNNYIIGQSGIGIGNSLSYGVQENEIVTSNTFGHGVFLYQSGSTRHGGITVEKNKIKTIQSVSGIYVTQCQNVLINNNRDIEILKNNPNFTDGIHIDNSDFCNITHNNIVGVDIPNTKAGANAIFMQNSNDNTFCCNTLDKTFTGVEVRDINNVENTFYTTSFGDHNTGLWLSGLQPIMGQQDHTGNLWNGKTTVGARNDNGVFQSINSNPFNVDNSSNPNLLPKVIETPNIPNANWFKNIPGFNIECNTKPEQGCYQQKPSGLNHVDRLLLEADAEKLNDYTKWQLTYHLYAKLSDNPSLIGNDDDLANFYEQAKSTPIATLVGIAEGIDYVKGYKTSTQATNEKNIKEKEAELIALQDKINSSEPDKNLTTEYNEVLKSIVVLSNSSDFSANNTEKIAMLQELLKRNASINTDALFEQNHKAINTVIINQLLSKDKKLTVPDVKILENIAYQCDRLGGDAVQTARGMLTWLNNQKYTFKREIGCENAVVSKIKKHTTDVKIYPNPSDGNLIFDNGVAANTTLCIYDMSGKIVLSQNVNDKLTPINVSYLNNGLYYCRVLGEENIIKFTIIH